MPHLDPERLAALDQAVPTSEERAHLAACAECRRERAAFARLAGLAARVAASEAAVVPADAPRLTQWHTLAAALRADGLITRPSDDMVDAETGASVVALPTMRDPGGSVTAGPVAARDGHAPRGAIAPRLRGGSAPRLPWGWRAAAAVALFVSGAAVGRVGMAPPVAPPIGAARVAGDAARGGPAGFGTVAEATAVLDRAQRDYERASLWLAAHDTTVNAQAVYRARLAALEQMLVASRAGLFEAPQDPLLNQYYLAAYTAREATLRQLGESLPVNRVMESF